MEKRRDKMNIKAKTKDANRKLKIVQISASQLKDLIASNGDGIILYIGNNLVKAGRPKTERKGSDNYGFRKGSVVGKVFEMLVKGTTLNQINKVAGNSAPYILHSIKANVGETFPSGRPIYSARGAVIKEDKKGLIRIVQYMDKDGNVCRL
jgi:hypothetical protein